jgi:hypothetical protein
MAKAENGLAGNSALDEGSSINCVFLLLLDGLLLFWRVLRFVVSFSPAVTGAATGVLAWLVGSSVLQIHCPNLDAWHILLSHLGVSALCSMAGLTLGRLTVRK